MADVEWVTLRGGKFDGWLVFDPKLRIGEDDVVKIIEGEDEHRYLIDENIVGRPTDRRKVQGSVWTYRPEDLA